MLAVAVRSPGSRSQTDVDAPTTRTRELVYVKQ